MPAEAGVDEPGGGVDQQAEPSEAGLALEPGRKIVAQGDDLVGGSQDELTGMQHERFLAERFNQTCQVGLVDGRIDVRVTVVLEDPEVAVQTDVHTRRLHHLRVIGLEHDALGFDRGSDIPVGQQHVRTLPAPPEGRD